MGCGGLSCLRFLSIKVGKELDTMTGYMGRKDFGFGQLKERSSGWWEEDLWL